MKTILISILFGALAEAQPAPRYTVTDLGTLGGTYSYGYGINSAGWVAGGSALKSQTDGLGQVAFIWYGAGPLINLGTLGGANSAADGPNASGEVVIGSETAQKDPNGEDFCAYGTHLQCLGVVWKNGVMSVLPNLKGGNNANPFGLNNRGDVVGFAENGVRDSTCATPFQVQRFEAVLWRNGQIKQLAPLPGDTVAFAFGNNDNGQVIGGSGLCANTSLPPAPGAPHAVLWESDGTPVNLGSLGGTFAVASSINNLGEAAGGAESPKDGNIHPFLWTRADGMQELPVFPGAALTVPPCCNTINNRGEIVGFSCDSMFNCRAVLWHGKTLLDMNALIPPDSPWYLINANGISDAGEIVGYGMINGDLHAFVATPASGLYEPAVTLPAVLPEHVRKELRRRLPFARSTMQ